MIRRRSRLALVASIVLVLVLYRSFFQHRDTRPAFDPPPGLKGNGHPIEHDPDSVRHNRPGPHDRHGDFNYDELPHVENKVGQPWVKQPPGTGNRNNKPDTTANVHWQRTPEFYPVAVKDLTPLPTQEPVQIPRIQYDFEKAPAETETQKSTRLARLEAVRDAMRHSWAGYRAKAWMHDEVRPRSGETRDPFCGWAATLVDALDTLWIMGLRDEFDEAAKAVGKIDFTTTPRDSIPVFETIIRYLGGLLAAYDVSGGKDGKYPILLTKAVELAEVLFPVFDTPNRMPVLYYRWKPEQVGGAPRRAGIVAVAELGSMTMELTRLAQLTGTNKYYDAAVRIVDALEELQGSSATRIPGLFPESLDASGCNQTALSEMKQAERQKLKEQEGEQEEEKGEKKDVDTGHGLARLHKRAPIKTGGVAVLPECVPQSLIPRAGTQSFSMGAAQDSTYEYFPKQYLLLGGVEQKYKNMHIKTVDAVSEHLLFRAMIPEDGRDVRFSAKVEFSPNPDLPPRVRYEAPHLTCFLGGMYALGGKIFDRPDDVDVGAKLADGCVWAYEAMPCGIMPETGTLAPCPDDTCRWNETEWHHRLDPDWADRDAKIVKWEDLRAQRDREIEDADRIANEDPKNPRKPSTPKTWVGQRPLSHAEFIIDKLKSQPPPEGYVSVDARYYILRPEAIESVWYMYRITGDRVWQDKGWRMWEAISRATKATWGYSALDDVSVPEGTRPSQSNAMESFWMAETLKYFYLLFEEPGVVSLDEWVFNTEAHPFKRPLPVQ